MVIDWSRWSLHSDDGRRDVLHTLSKTILLRWRYECDVLRWRWGAIAMADDADRWPALRWRELVMAAIFAFTCFRVFAHVDIFRNVKCPGTYEATKQHQIGATVTKHTTNIFQSTSKPTLFSRPCGPQRKQICACHFMNSSSVPGLQSDFSGPPGGAKRIEYIYIYIYIYSILTRMYHPLVNMWSR